MPVLLALRTLISKDFHVDVRRKTEAAGATVFSIAAAITTSYVESRGGWVGGFFASYITSSVLVMLFLAVFASLASFIREREEGTLEGLQLVPVSPEVLFTAKMIYSFIWIFVQLFVYFVSLLFFSGESAIVLFNPFLLAVFTVTALYLAGVSSLVSAILVYSEARSVLLPVTVLVLVLPYFQSLIPVIVEIHRGVFSLTALMGPIATTAGFLALAVLLARYVLEAF